MAEYFLPDMNLLKILTCAFDIKILTPDDFANLYLPQWSNALCEKRKHLDMMAIAAFDGDKLIGLAGCSADCDTMWQIGGLLKTILLPAKVRRESSSFLCEPFSQCHSKDRRTDQCR